MRIDFIGNSHLGTIAPELSRHRGGREIAHFISRTYGSVAPSLVAGDDHRALPYIKLEEASPYGATIDLGRSDVVVAVGLNFSLVQMVKLWTHYCPVASGGEYGVTTLTEPLWDAYVDAAFDATHMGRLVAQLTDMGAVEVVVVPQPAPAQWAAHRDGPKFAIYRELTRAEDWDRVRVDFDRQLVRLEQIGVRVFRQPAETLTGSGFTDDRFAMGDPADQSETSFYARGDFYHMNREFARRVSPRLYSWLDRSGHAPSRQD